MSSKQSSLKRDVAILSKCASNTKRTMLYDLEVVFMVQEVSSAQIMSTTHKSTAIVLAELELDCNIKVYLITMVQE